MLGAITAACVQIRKQLFAAIEEWVMIWKDAKNIARDDDNFWVVSLGGWSLQVDKG